MTKKRIAIVCVILNLVLLTQVCFGSVSALYDAVMSSEVDEHEHDGHVHEETAQAELQAESVCSQQQLENAKCACTHPTTTTDQTYVRCGACNVGSKSVTIKSCTVSNCRQVISTMYGKCGHCGK